MNGGGSRCNWAATSFSMYTRNGKTSENRLENRSGTTTLCSNDTTRNDDVRFNRVRRRTRTFHVRVYIYMYVEVWFSSDQFWFLDRLPRDYFDTQYTLLRRYLDRVVGLAIEFV